MVEVSAFAVPRQAPVGEDAIFLGKFDGGAGQPLLQLRLPHQRDRLGQRVVLLLLLDDLDALLSLAALVLGGLVLRRLVFDDLVLGASVLGGFVPGRRVPWI